MPVMNPAASMPTVLPRASRPLPVADLACTPTELSSVSQRPYTPMLVYPLVSGKVVSSSWLPDHPSTPTLLPLDHPVVAGLVVLVDSPQTPQPAPVPRTPVPLVLLDAAAL